MTDSEEELQFSKVIGFLKMQIGPLSSGWVVMGPGIEVLESLLMCLLLNRWDED